MRDLFSAPLSRRDWLRAQTLIAGGAIATQAFGEDVVKLPFENGERRLVKYPGKRPLMVLTSRPPQLETPFEVFNEGVITPNDAFFVRYHLAGLPTEIDPDTHKLSVGGNVDKPLSFTLAELKKDFPAVEVTAVLQCSGNSRGFQTPRVVGGQLGNGAMGNAVWKGVRLKDLLEKAGVKAGSKQVSFNGLDKAVIEKTPDFIKAIELDQALDGELIIAYEMNGEPLPFLNGFPLRLVVPGYYGTYWVKHLNEITVLSEPFTGFWNATAYRIPDNGCGFIEPGTTAAKTTEIKRYKVRSFITSLLDGAQIKAGKAMTLKGIAFDGGYGIREVQVSLNGGKTWSDVTLGKDLGNYSFREWEVPGLKLPAGAHELKVRAFNRVGESQPLEAQWNPNGYLRNVVETTRIEAV
ncbi:MAG: oxidase [Verrucomicrobiaceae bacterium]|nr:oxidase [Verrucomicrobiaceae bacterium]